MNAARRDPAIHLHALRHPFATCLLERGANVTALQKLRGHSTNLTTMEYTHLVPSTMHNVVARLKTVGVQGSRPHE